MWELIRQNKRKSVSLFICMGICLLLLGYFIGAAYFPPDGGIGGLFFAAAVWLALSLISFFSGDSIILSMSNAKEVSHDVHPRLFNIVEEMKIAANLPIMPKVYIIDESAPNAFATGMKLEKCSVAVTAGLLSKLNRDELQGVIGHELSHVVNRDVMFVTLAGIMLGSITLISESFLRSMWYNSGSSRRYRGGGRGAGQAQLIIILLAILFAVLAPIMARLFYFAISRKREYLADASSARFTRYPEGLASALEKISASDLSLASANRITAPMYIVNPLASNDMGISDLSSTHPPISERIKILRGMMHGANYTNYQQAFENIRGKKAFIIPSSGMRDTDFVPIRKPGMEREPILSEKQKARDLGDLVRAVNSFAFLMCACGLKIKIPPDFKNHELACPRCQRTIKIPLSSLGTVMSAAAITADKDKIRKFHGEEQAYVRTTNGWESLACSCGKLMQLSPLFSGRHIICDFCGAKTIIKNSGESN